MSNPLNNKIFAVDLLDVFILKICLVNKILLYKVDPYSMSFTCTSCTRDTDLIQKTTIKIKVTQSSIEK